MTTGKLTTILASWMLFAAFVGAALASDGTALAASPRLSLRPTTAAPASTIKVKGSRFPKRADGQLVWDANGTVLAAFSTGSTGSFSASFKVPAVPTGSYGITATVLDATTGSVAIATSSILVEAGAPPTPTDTPPPSPTNPPPSPTNSPSPTPSPTTPPSLTATPLPSATPSSTPTKAPTPTRTPTPTSTAQAISGDSLSLPIRAAFYYPWFPAAWSQGGIYPYTNYHPSLGFYDGGDPAVIAQQIAAMQYGGIQAGIASWWGQGHHTDSRLPALLAGAAGTGFKWTVYYEAESQGDPTVSQITSDLAYIRDRYASDPSYLRIGGQFVVFVYADVADACSMADRWKQANTVGAYVVLKVFSGYRTCASQPAGWHQYAPSAAADSQSGYAYSISPGFWKVGETPRLERDLARWQQNVRDMVASGAPFQLITTFNEWGEGTAVESATEWATASGYGAYLDALHTNGNGSPPPAATPTATPTKTSTSSATPSPTPTRTPTSGTGTDAVLLAAGDIAGCSTTGDEATAKLLDGLAGTVATLGDNVYDSGTASEFANCYDPTWGRHKARTHPSVGNHEYLTAGASGYFDYFGAAAGDPSKGYYSYDLGSWHVVVINSNLSMSSGSAQEQWLRADLAAHPAACTLAYWHRPRFSSGTEHGSSTAPQPIWQALYDYGAEVVLVGHEHNYERFAPQTATGALDTNSGLREFVVGTGGKNHYGFGTIQPNSEVRNADTFGVLQLTLRSNGYDWRFVPEAGKSFTDSGSGTCHGKPSSASAAGEGLLFAKIDGIGRDVESFGSVLLSGSDVGRLSDRLSFASADWLWLVACFPLIIVATPRQRRRLLKRRVERSSAERVVRTGVPGQCARTRSRWSGRAVLSSTAPPDLPVG